MYTVVYTGLSVFRICDAKIIKSAHYTSLSRLILYYTPYVIIFRFNIILIYTLNINGLTKNVYQVPCLTPLCLADKGCVRTLSWFIL
jgi:hypothetical protein